MSDSGSESESEQWVPSTSVDDFRRVLASSTHIVVVAGAGLSAASGIPTFRDTGGLWHGRDPDEVATPAAFAKDPAMVWQFYHKRREEAKRAQPNAGHYALAMLCEPAHLRAVAPRARSLSLFTQNIDGLNTRAREAVGRHVWPMGRAPGAGVPHPLFEMHGRVLDTLCTVCGYREHNVMDLACPALSDETRDPASISLEDLPRCARCKGLLRPDVVWFEEVPHDLPTIDALVARADLCIVIGTSSTVQPAASFAYEVVDRGGASAVFNIARSDGDEESDFLFIGPCEETLPRILLGVGQAPQNGTTA
ncbi:DHS-like NAD/FAD-binding domain-containing protein [Schizophyllum commune]